MIAFQHLRAAIFDWAGTVIDHGSLAPMGAFVKAFGEFGVTIAIEEARGPMGMAKRPHIAALMALPRIANPGRPAAAGCRKSVTSTRCSRSSCQ